MPIEADTLIVGCGIAGSAAALRLAEDRQREIITITRAASPEETNTRYAQGGIIARGVHDSPELLTQDILAAGGGICNPAAVRLLAETGPELVHEVLIKQAGVEFDREPDGSLSYTREARHSENRILHVGDCTGQAIQEALLRKLATYPNVTIRANMTLVDLVTTSHHLRSPDALYEPITCLGAYVLDNATGCVHRILASATILAAGGLGMLYRYTTNPAGARGDGLAAAYRAGARIINSEYVQFHPTTLAVPGTNNFLISESVRGEGARLFTPDGRHFMEEYSPRWKDLAPRDEVARAIHTEMINHGYPHVLLDMANYMDRDRIPERFPTIYNTCREAGIDITREPIPVVPAAHYACGGVLVDLWGRTNIRGLYAAGEVSCTGVHGANRLASTSLLEGLVWGQRAATHIAEHEDELPDFHREVPQWESVSDRAVPDPVLIYNDRRTIQNTMWLYVGLARNRHRLLRAQSDLNHILETIDHFYRTSRLTDELVGLRNMAQVARIITMAAWSNRVSRGAHYREDAKPEDDDFASLRDAAPASTASNEALLPDE